MQNRELKAHAFGAIRDLAVEVYKHSSTEFDDDELKDLGIEVGFMDLTTGEANDGYEQFCKPYSQEKFEKLLSERNNAIDWEKWGKLHERFYAEGDDDDKYWYDDTNYDEAINTEHMLNHLLRYVVADDTQGTYHFRDSVQGPFESLTWCGRNDLPGWQVHVYGDAQDTSKSHLTYALYDSTIPQEQGLRRSELFCALAPMAGRFFDRKYRWKHRVAPVIVCSLAADQARVIQAHYDIYEKRFIIRRTKPFTVKRVIGENSKLLVRWIINEPCGNTFDQPQSVRSSN